MNELEWLQQLLQQRQQAEQDLLGSSPFRLGMPTPGSCVIEPRQMMGLDLALKDDPENPDLLTLKKHLIGQMSQIQEGEIRSREIAEMP